MWEWARDSVSQARLPPDTEAWELEDGAWEQEVGRKKGWLGNSVGALNG